MRCVCSAGLFAVIVPGGRCISGESDGGLEQNLFQDCAGLCGAQGAKRGVSNLYSPRVDVTLCWQLRGILGECQQGMCTTGDAGCAVQTCSQHLNAGPAGARAAGQGPRLPAGLTGLPSLSFSLSLFFLPLSFPLLSVTEAVKHPVAVPAGCVSKLLRLCFGIAWSGRKSNFPCSIKCLR